MRSIVKNTPSATIFDVGATGSQIPNEIDPNMSVHLFDPAFKPSGNAFVDETTYVMYKEPVNYDVPNVHEDRIDESWNLENALRDYHGLYSV